MQTTIENLQQRIRTVAEYWQTLSEADRQAKDSPAKWSKKQVLGHLCDSAQTNIRRMVVGQYQTDANIIYEQNIWVKAADYQHYDSSQLLYFWMLLNQHFCIVLSNLPEENYSTTTNWGNTTPDLVSLKYVAEDYVKHLDHHLLQMGIDLGKTTSQYHFTA